MQYLMPGIIKLSHVISVNVGEEAHEFSFSPCVRFVQLPLTSQSRSEVFIIRSGEWSLVNYCALSYCMVLRCRLYKCAI